MSSPSRATRQRYFVVMAATLMAVLLYLDRICISFLEIYIKQALELTDAQIGWIVGAFFYSYALGQVPAGWLSDRFGGRLMLTIYILMWSAFTALTGLASGFMALFLFRLGFGFGQSGAYPTAANIISKWVPFTARGTASSIVSMGGRVGGALAPLLTALLLVAFVPLSVSSLLDPKDLMSPRLAYEITLGEHLDESGSDPNQRLKVAAGQRVLELLPEDTAETLRHWGHRYAAALQRPGSQADSTSDTAAPDDGSGAADRADILAQLQQQFSAVRPELIEPLNALLADPRLYSPEIFQPTSLSQEAQRLLTQQPQSAAAQLSHSEQTRLNRLLLESAFPDIRKVYGEGWRDVMFLYGLVGMGVALMFWWVVRDEPSLHPRCNEAELAHIERGRPATIAASRGKARGLPLRTILTSRNMLLTSISQFMTNFGWVFLITWLPRYLDEVHRIPVEQRGFYVLLPIMVGWAGMLSGGPLTDWLVRKIGLRWGRALPMSLTRFMAMAGYLICLSPYIVPGTELPFWMYAAAFSLVAFSTDLGTASVWAFNQDIAGKHVGSVLGWGNMWGNFGAAVASPLLIVLKDYGWQWPFAMSAAAFFISGIAAIAIDATVPLRVEPDDQPA